MEEAIFHDKDALEQEIQQVVCELWSIFSNESRQKIYRFVSNLKKDFKEADYDDLVEKGKAAISSGKIDDYLDTGDVKMLEESKSVEYIEMPHEEYTEVKDIIRINKELDKKAREGKLIGLRKEKDKLMLAEPAINGIWTLFLNDNGGIVRITLW